MNLAGGLSKSSKWNKWNTAKEAMTTIAQNNMSKSRERRGILFTYYAYDTERVVQCPVQPVPQHPSHCRPGIAGRTRMLHWGWFTCDQNETSFNPLWRSQREACNDHEVESYIRPQSLGLALAVWWTARASLRRRRAFWDRLYLRSVSVCRTCACLETSRALAPLRGCRGLFFIQEGRVYILLAVTSNNLFLPCDLRLSQDLKPIGQPRPPWGGLHETESACVFLFSFVSSCVEAI